MKKKYTAATWLNNRKATNFTKDVLQQVLYD